MRETPSLNRSEARPATPPAEAAGRYLADAPPRRRHLLLAAGIVAAVYLAGVTGQWWPTPDSALYQGLARSLIQGEGYRFNGRVNTDVTPGMPAILAALRWLFGPACGPPNLFVALTGLGSLAMAYLALSRLASRRMALAAVLAAAASYKYFHYCHLILTDSTFSLLFWGFLYASVRYLRGGGRWLAAALLLAGLAVLVRAPGLLILGPAAAGLVLHRGFGTRPARRLVGGAAVLGVLTALAGGLYLLARAASEAVPLYASGPRAEVDPAARLVHVGRGLAALPAVVARLFTAQSSAAVGAAILVLAAVGAVCLWRRGRRLAATTCLLCVVGSPFLGGARAIRARYLMAILPLLALLCLEGLCWLVDRVVRWRSRPPGRAAYVTGVSLFVGLIVVVNAPKVARDTFQYGYAAWTGRYWQTIEDGAFSDLAANAEALRGLFGPDEPVAVRRDRSSMLHLLSERRMAPFLKLPRGRDPATAADAERIYANVRARPDVRGIVLDRAGIKPAFAGRLERLVTDEPAWRLLHETRTCRVFRRATAAVPATQPAEGTGP